MPRVVKTLDQIARAKQRDVLYITFHQQPESESTADIDEQDDTPFDWEGCANRKAVISFLDAQNIPYQVCFDPQPTSGVVILAMPYEGQIYIDFPYDESDTQCKKLESYLENTDGTTKLPGVHFWLYPLDIAMENAEHDEPGFWENM